VARRCGVLRGCAAEVPEAEPAQDSKKGRHPVRLPDDRRCRPEGKNWRDFSKPGTGTPTSPASHRRAGRRRATRYTDAGGAAVRRLCRCRAFVGLAENHEAAGQRIATVRPRNAPSPIRERMVYPRRSRGHSGELCDAERSGRITQSARGQEGRALSLQCGLRGCSYRRHCPGVLSAGPRDGASCSSPPNTGSRGCPAPLERPAPLTAAVPDRARAPSGSPSPAIPTAASIRRPAGRPCAGGHFLRKARSAVLTSSAWVHSRPCGAPSTST